MRPYHTLSKLDSGAVVYVDGVHCQMATIEVDGQQRRAPLQPDDRYVAERNTGPQLLTVESVNDEEGWVNPVEPAYPYDTDECIKVDILRRGADADLNKLSGPSVSELQEAAAILKRGGTMVWLKFCEPKTDYEVLFGAAELMEIEGNWLLMTHRKSSHTVELTASDNAAEVSS